VNYLEGNNSQHLFGLGLGNHLLQQEAHLRQQEAFEMEVPTAILKVPVGTTKRKRRGCG
jgi:hypothetical protein